MLDYYFYSNITRTYGTGAKVYYRQQHFEGSGASIEKPSNTNVSGQEISITDTKSGNSIKSRYTISHICENITIINIKFTSIRHICNKVIIYYSTSWIIYYKNKI